MRRRLRARHVALIVATIALATGGLAATASAEGVPCHGDVVVPINGVRLLNQDGSRTAGPYPVALEAGRYRIDAVSFDGYHGDPDQITQPEEQWQIVTDSGFVSGFTIDIPDDEQATYTIFPDNTLPATTSILLSHRGIGNINSVDPVCVGFTRLPDDDDSAGDPEDGEPTSDDPGSNQPESGAPEESEPADPAEPADPGGAPDDGDTPPDGDVPVDTGPGGEDPGEPGDGDPAAPTTPDDGSEPEAGAPGPDDGSEPEAGAPGPDDADDPDEGGDPDDGGDPQVAPPGTDDTSEPIEPEVQGKVEEPGPTPALARTGFDDLSTRLLGAALVLIGLGGLAVRRSESLTGA